jgi:hypothetical protein
MSRIETISAFHQRVSDFSRGEHGKEDIEFMRFFGAVEDECWWGGEGGLLRYIVSVPVSIISGQ